jgi:asparagine synthase (glutamine-hydrolysing)
MCSIVVTFNESNLGTLTAMADAVKHRGPDSMEIWPAGSHGVAACRLSIFGDPDATMTYLDAESGAVVLLNGEIYNYEDLWNQLSANGERRTSDLETELIARLYKIHGVDFARYLKGMFSIVILTGDKLVLARDRFGIKPLYYKPIGHKVVVCSEIKGILQHPDVTAVLDHTALEETRVFGYVVDQELTFFKGVRQVKPGSTTVFSNDGAVDTKDYGSFPAAHYDGAGSDYQAACRDVREKMIAAVEKLFNHGTMDKGIYLSGGLDSSTIALVARKLLGYPVQTFSLADSDDNTDLLSARRMAATLGTQHCEYLVTSRDYWRSLLDYVAHYESLMAGGVFDIQGGVAFHLLSERASKAVKVTFTGEGADELFGGYYWIYTHPLGFSDRIRTNLSNILPNPRMARFVDELFPAPEDEKLYRRNLFDHLVRSGLSNYHLQSVDRSAGAFGFEIRPLYLYDDLADCALQLPIEYKVPDKKTTKKILRDAFRADFEAMGLGWVNRRLKLGMPAAISRMDQEVTQSIEKAISVEELQRHPLGNLLGSKMNLLLYDLFEHIFFKGWDHRGAEPPPDSLLARVWPE